MLITLYVVLSVVEILIGGYLVALGLKNLKNAFDHAFRVRLAPGYEVTGSLSPAYVSGSRDMDSHLYGDANPSRLVYHERGLLVFTRGWTFEMWVRGIMINLAACVIFCGLGLAALYYGGIYLWSFTQ